MVIAISPDSVFPYVTKADRDLPEEQQTKFLLRQLGHAQRLQVMQIVHQSASGLRVSDWREILRAGLAGWENLRKADGTPANFRQDPKQPVLGQNVQPASDVSLDFLDTETLIELAGRVVELSKLGADEGKP